ncbi:MAG: hypothetical protein ACI4MS_02745 [Candidatus Coproplasma sp.]
MTPYYKKCIRNPEEFGKVILGVLSNKPTSKDCNVAVSFMDMFASQLSTEFLQQIYDKLKSIECATKALEAIKNNAELTKILK